MDKFRQNSRTLPVWPPTVCLALCHLCREKERSLAAAGQPVIQPQRPDGPRFTGGGFSFKQHNRMTLQALEQQSWCPPESSEDPLHPSSPLDRPYFLVFIQLYWCWPASQSAAVSNALKSVLSRLESNKACYFHWKVSVSFCIKHSHKSTHTISICLSSPLSLSDVVLSCFLVCRCCWLLCIIWLSTCRCPQHPVTCFFLGMWLFVDLWVCAMNFILVGLWYCNCF